MKAATIRAYGGPDVLRVEELPEPVLRPRDVLVEVRAAGVNPVDCKIRSGAQRAFIRHRMPAVLGLDVSGVVLEVGAKARRFRRGDEVYGSPTHARQGTYAARVAIDESELARKPKSVSHVDAASLPLVAQTAWQCLVTSANLLASEKVFIQAGAGGVGTFAIQLAKHLGATIATTCSAANAELVKSLGADVVVDHRRERFEEVLSGYDVVLESIGGEDRARALRVLRPGGRLVYITSGLPERTARHGPYFGAAFAIGDMLRFGVSARFGGKRAAFVVRRPNAAQLSEIAALVDRGVVRPVVERTFPLELVADAHRAIESGKTRGKIVIDMSLAVAG
jgi:NADPH:quinone reductase-like Zn-dependent oxidoreductase